MKVYMHFVLLIAWLCDFSYSVKYVLVPESAVDGVVDDDRTLLNDGDSWDSNDVFQNACISDNLI